MFEHWDSYFAMLGTAAGGLIGLLFVVVTLTSNFERSQALKGTSIYMTPTAIHFAAALSICAAALAPNLAPRTAATLMALPVAVGLANAVRAGVGIRGFTGQTGAVHWSDFWSYAAAPAVVYAALIVALGGVWTGKAWGVGALASGLLLLLLVAIRNAWDLVTWMAPQGSFDPHALTPPSEPEGRERPKRGR